MDIIQSHGLYPRWRSQVLRAGYFRAGERVGVAVSGGADSILLLHLMTDLGMELGLRVAAVHYNHGLRGEASDGDEAFVQAAAQRLGVEFHAGRGDVAAECRRARGNLEATARRMRYRFFDSVVEKEHLACVATAHTANDQAETVLLRLLRGSGLRGLSGIHPVLDAKIVRPFLQVKRSVVLDEIKRRGLDYREDESNLDLRFARNRVRHQLLPLLQKDYSERIVEHLANLAEQSRLDEALLMQLASEQGGRWIRNGGGEVRIDVRALGNLSPALRGRVLRQMAETLGGSAVGLSNTHLETLRRLAEEHKSGHGLVLTGGLQARREFNNLIIERSSTMLPLNTFCVPIVLPAVVDMPGLGVKIRFQAREIVHARGSQREYNEVKGERLDLDRLTGKLTLRSWRAGDAYQPAGRLHSLKIKELFSRQRVPLSKRRVWPVLEDERGIVWVRSFPPASTVAACPTTHRCVEVSEESLGVPGESPAAE
jgi:tRNA(Ile)-lysidine synthase